LEAAATVNVAVAALVPLIVTEAGTLQVIGMTGPPNGLVGVVVIVQVRFTRPVKPPEGVTVIVDVLAEAAPGFTVMFPLLLRVKPEFGEPVTVTVTAPLDEV
jgi:acyl dehydratase